MKQITSQIKVEAEIDTKGYKKKTVAEFAESPPISLYFLSLIIIYCCLCDLTLLIVLGYS